MTRITQVFQGHVVELDANEFVAILEDATDSSLPDELASIKIEAVQESERQYIELGAFFKWTITVDENGENGISVFEFNKEVWTKEDLENANKRADELFRGLGWGTDD